MLNIIMEPASWPEKVEPGWCIGGLTCFGTNASNIAGALTELTCPFQEMYHLKIF